MLCGVLSERFNMRVSYPGQRPRNGIRPMISVLKERRINDIGTKIFLKKQEARGVVQKILRITALTDQFASENLAMRQSFFLPAPPLSFQLPLHRKKATETWPSQSQGLTAHFSWVQTVTLYRGSAEISRLESL